MSAEDVLKELAGLGVRLIADGDRLRYMPQSAVPPEVVSRMKAHKTEILQILSSEAYAPHVDLSDARAVWNMALDRLEGDPDFPRHLLKALRAAGARWETDPAPVGEEDRDSRLHPNSVLEGVDKSVGRSRLRPSQWPTCRANAAAP